jgi:hypothetical protein
MIDLDDSNLQKRSQVAAWHHTKSEAVKTQSHGFPA